MDKALVWFRRDLRTSDHHALAQALQQAQRVWTVFVFDTTILQPLLARQRIDDRRLSFIHANLEALDETLRKHGGGLIILHGNPIKVIPDLAQRLQIDTVFFNEDIEPAAQKRDAEVRQCLEAQGCKAMAYHDLTIFTKNQLLTGQKKPYTVYTPYQKAWLKLLQPHQDLNDYTIKLNHGKLHLPPAPFNQGIPTLDTLGFKQINLKIPIGEKGAQELLNDFSHRIQHYATRRDFPGQKGPSYLSAHLRFGTVSTRAAFRLAQQSADMNEGAHIWRAELIWREFYFYILAHYPELSSPATHSTQGYASFRPAYDAIVWEKGIHAEQHFQAWCQGETGYPIVDAGMRQLNQTGYMHNRLRMIAASFLIKDLGIDWRWGEQYFADHLLDFDFSANNGGWQWVASSGCDAQPYFRIFNPITQSEKFDPQGHFIRRYLPELAHLSDRVIHAPWLHGIQVKNYPAPLVDHALAREKTLNRYKVVKMDKVSETSFKPGG